MVKYIPYIVCMAIGSVLTFLFFKPEVKETIVEVVKVKTDTVYQVETETLRVPYEVLVERIDTVYYSKPFEANISRYSGSEVITYGKIDWMAETTGKLTDITITPYLDLPVITKEIEKTKTITQTRDLRGLYLGGGVSNKIDWKAGVSYVDKDWLFGYDYEIGREIHWLGFKRRLIPF